MEIMMVVCPKCGQVNVTGGPCAVCSPGEADRLAKTVRMADMAQGAGVGSSAVWGGGDFAAAAERR